VIILIIIIILLCLMMTLVIITMINIRITVMTNEGRSITEKTPAFIPNNNCLRGSKRGAK